MIRKGTCNLYQKVENWNGIATVMFKSGKIRTYWYKVNREKCAKYDKKRYEKRYGESKQIMRELKSNGCAICGYDECDEALDFHHANPKDKKFPVNSNNNRSNSIFAEEVNKCILLCANCHRKVHAEERL